MKIGVNTRFLLSSKMEGFGWFTYETVKRIVLNHPEVEFVFFFDRPYDEKFIFAKNVTPVVLYPPARHPILFKIWFNWSITRALKKHKITTFLSPDGYLSLRTKVKQIGVVHDIYFEYYPEDLKKRDSKYLRSQFPLFAKKADKIITVSNFSKTDICAKYGINPEKIDVAYNGASDSFYPIASSEQETIRTQYTNSNPYFLFVGALQPRKNLSRLLLAFDEFKKETQSDYKLLVVGEAYFWSAEMKMILAEMKFKSSVHFTGHVSTDELRNTMASAEALTFVSYYEGFGIPIVEAMKCGCPVLVGENTACEEIGGDATLICDPFDVNSIKNSLVKLASDSELKNDLKQKGLVRAKLFTWDKTAEIIWKNIEEINY